MANLLVPWLLLALQAPTLEADLDRIGATAAVMLDGDICQRIVTARAQQFLLKKDPQDPYADSDNYDVNAAEFITTKKTLTRLAMLSDRPIGVNLWMPIAGRPPRIHIVVRSKVEMSQFWTWGQLHSDVPPVMAEVLKTGQRRTVKDKPGVISVLAPVRNSLGDIVGLVEVVSDSKSSLHATTVPAAAGPHSASSLLFIPDTRCGRDPLYRAVQFHVPPVLTPTSGDGGISTSQGVYR